LLCDDQEAHEPPSHFLGSAAFSVRRLTMKKKKKKEWKEKEKQ